MSPPATHRASATARGFTLIEVMVVVTILGLLATLVATNVVDQADTARDRKAATDLQVIAAAVRHYRADSGKLPTLADLTAPDAKGRRYLEELSTDPWDHEYVLRVPTDEREWEVVSAGANGQLGDADDLSSRHPR